MADCRRSDSRTRSYVSMCHGGIIAGNGGRGAARSAAALGVGEPPGEKTPFRLIAWTVQRGAVTPGGARMIAELRQEPRLDRRQEVVVGQHGIALERRDARERRQRPVHLAQATARFSAAIGEGAMRSSSS